MANPYNSGEHVKVWEAAHGPVPEGYLVHHKDHDKSNNSLENLELLTHKQHFREHEAERGPDWHSKGGKASIEKRRQNPVVNVCEHCSEEFSTIWPARFCADRCRDLHFREHPDESRQYAELVCGYCGEKFYRKVTKKRTPRFCSTLCRNGGARGQSLRSVSA